MRFLQENKQFRNINLRPIAAILCLASLALSAFGQMGQMKGVSVESPSILPEMTKADSTSTCQATAIAMTGNTASDGADGNIRTFGAGGINVKVSGFSRRNSDGLWETGYVGAYGPGLGVTDRGEADGSNNRHKVDNIGDRKNYMLFEFDQTVIVDRAYLDSVGADSDATVWIGNANSPYYNHLTLNDSLLTSFGSEDNNASNNAARWADFNASNRSGNVLIIAASTTEATTDDEFKIGQLSVQCAPPPPPCVAGAIATTGNTGVTGTNGNIRTFSNGSVSVKASGFSRRKSDGLWETGYVGAYGPGLGVTDRGEDGNNNTHKVDNIGDRLNYMLFEFDRAVVVDRVYLDSIGVDSDATVWIGNANDPYNNHLTLSDALLTSFGSENNNASNNATRWADVNSGAEAGNVLVVAASTSASPQDDEFKIGSIDVKCPSTPATVTIIKQVQGTGGVTSSTQSFPFTATNFGVSNFSLVDQNVTGPDRITNNSVYNFGTNHPVTVTESLTSGWTLLDITCTETGGTQNTTTDLSTRKATIVVEPGENVVCTFTNGQIRPSAGTAAVTGRILTSDGRAVSGAVMVLTNASTGTQRIARTNPFGYYSFDGLEVAEFYSLSVSHKRYTFAPDTQFFTLNADLGGADFIAIQ